MQIFKPMIGHLLALTVALPLQAQTPASPPPGEKNPPTAAKTSPAASPSKPAAPPSKEKPAAKPKLSKKGKATGKSSAKGNPSAPAAVSVKPTPASPAANAQAPLKPDTAAPKATEPDAGANPPPSPVVDEPKPSNIPADRMPTLALKVSPKTAMIGEVIKWELSVKRRKEDSIHLGSSANFGSLEIKSKSKDETPIDNTWVKETLVVDLIGFDAEDVVIPAQTLTVVDVNGGIAEIQTDEAHVTIKSLIANEPEPKLKEDTGPGEKVMEENYLLLYVLLGLAAALAVALLTLLGRKLWAMRRPKPEPPPPPPRPAEEVAYEKLNALKESHLLDEGEFKEFHVRLSEAVREYIGNRYGFDSLELSSEELVQALRHVEISKTEYDLVLDFLGDTDLVKFAKVLPTVSESEMLLRHSFGFVERTTPKIVPAQSADGEATKTPKGGDR